MRLKLTQPYLFISSGAILYLGKSLDTEFHEHHLFQLILGLETNFSIITDNGECNSRALLLDADQKHKLNSRGGWNLIVLLDPDTTHVQNLKSLMKDKILEETDPAQFEDITVSDSENNSDLPSQKQLSELLSLVLGRLNCGINKDNKDPRIKQLLGYIETLENKQISASDLARTVGLSENRLIHLFTSEVGIPLRRYLLWKRLMTAITFILKGADFTEAAHAAYFSDSAHLSRTFKKTFGVTMLSLFKNFKNSQFVQVILE